MNIAFAGYLVDDAGAPTGPSSHVFFAAMFLGLVLGLLLGLIPFHLARTKGRTPLGAAALLTCTVCSALLGLILGVAVVVLFTIIIIVLGQAENSGQSPSGLYRPTPPPMFRKKR